MLLQFVCFCGSKAISPLPSQILSCSYFREITGETKGKTLQCWRFLHGISVLPGCKPRLCAWRRLPSTRQIFSQSLDGLQVMNILNQKQHFPTVLQNGLVILNTQKGWAPGVLLSQTLHFYQYVTNKMTWELLIVVSVSCLISSKVGCIFVC